MECRNCDKEIMGSPRVWRWESTCMFGHGLSAPQREVGKLLDEWDYVFCDDACLNHYQGQKFRYWEGIDQPMNSCRYFVRDGGSMLGWYRREGKEHKVAAKWTDQEIVFEDVTPEEDWASISSFRSFLKENGWLNNWWEHRKGKSPTDYQRDYAQPT